MITLHLKKKFFDQINYFRLVSLCPSCFSLWEKEGLIKNKPNKTK